jgi:hypothetical protein
MFEHAAGLAHGLMRKAAATQQEGHESDTSDRAEEGFERLHDLEFVSQAQTGRPAATPAAGHDLL